MPSLKTALFISIDGITDQLGQSQILPYLAGLSDTGFRVEIISCEKKQNFEKNRQTVEAIMQKHDIHWSYCFYDNHTPLLSQFKNYSNLSKLTESRIRFHQGHVFLHCRSYLPGLIGLRMNKKHKTPFVFDMRGFWADERVDGNIWNLKSPVQNYLYKFFKRKEKEMIRHAAYVVTLTETAREEIQSWQLPALPPMEVIPCCADLEHFHINSETDQRTARAGFGITPKTLVLGYLGSLGTWYMMDEMLDFFIEFRHIHPDSKFFFVTNDTPEVIFRAASRKGIPESALIVREARRHEVPLFISCFDIGIFFIKPLYSKKGSSPTKLAELLACGIPFITNAGIGDMDRFVQKTGSGLVIDDFSKESYRQISSRADSLLKASKSDYRTIAEIHFSLTYGIQKYQKIYSYLSVL